MAGSCLTQSAGDTRNFIIREIHQGNSAWNRNGAAGSGLRSSLSVLKERLQDQYCGHLIDYAAMLLARMASFVEDLMRFFGCEALVPQVDRQTGQFAEFGGERLRFCGPRALFAREVQRITDDDTGNAVTPREARQGAQVIPWIAFTLEGQHGLRGEAQLVGDGHADAFRSDVEGEIAQWSIGIRHSSPKSSLKRTGRTRWEYCTQIQ